MLYRKMPKTGDELSILGFGCMRLPMTKEGKIDEPRAIRQMHQAIDRGGWVIDYCHCPMPGEPIHPWKDCTSEQLAERFETVLSVGGDQVWLAEPNEVVDYIKRSGK